MSAVSTAVAAELAREAGRLARAEQTLNYVFKDRALLLSALTHVSFPNEQPTHVATNQTLEFLGDAVVGLVAAAALFRAHGHAPEGRLTAQRAGYVSEPALSLACERHGLLALLRVGKGAGAERSVRADLVEALLGAVYADGGLAPAEQCALSLLGPLPTSAAAPTDNPKRDLQERLQALFARGPTYDVERVGGPLHAPVYEASARFDGVVLASGQGASKKLATEEAARAAVAALPDDAALRLRFGARTQVR